MGHLIRSVRADHGLYDLPDLGSGAVILLRKNIEEIVDELAAGSPLELIQEDGEDGLVLTVVGTVGAAGSDAAFVEGAGFPTFGELGDFGMARVEADTGGIAVGLGKEGARGFEIFESAGMGPVADVSAAEWTIEAVPAENFADARERSDEEVAGIKPQNRTAALAQSVGDDDGFPGVLAAGDADVEVRRVVLKGKAAEVAAAPAELRGFAGGEAEIVDDQRRARFEGGNGEEEIAKAGEVIAAGASDESERTHGQDSNTNEMDLHEELRR